MADNAITIQLVLEVSPRFKIAGPTSLHLWRRQTGHLPFMSETILLTPNKSKLAASGLLRGEEFGVTLTQKRIFQNHGLARDHPTPPMKERAKLTVSTGTSRTALVRKIRLRHVSQAADKARSVLATTTVSVTSGVTPICTMELAPGPLIARS